MPVITVVLLGVAAAMVYGATAQYRTESFLETGGRVVRTEIEESTSTTGGSRSTSYEPIIEYEFSVNDTRYESNQYTLGVRMLGGKDDAEQELSQHPVGSEIRVFYDPEDPTCSVLVTGTGSGEIIFIAIAILLVGLTVLGWVITIGKFRAYAAYKARKVA